MQTLIAIAIVVMALFGPSWSSEHKDYWEWKLGHPLEGHQEQRLSRGWHPYGGGPLLPDGGEGPNIPATECLDNDDTEFGTGFIPPQSRPAFCSHLDVFCAARRF